jgi:hypothetical protein
MVVPLPVSLLYHGDQHESKRLQKKTTYGSIAHQLEFVVLASIVILIKLTGPKSHVLVPPNWTANSAY